MIKKDKKYLNKQLPEIVKGVITYGGGNMIELVEQDSGGVVALKVIKPICQKDYHFLLPLIEKKIEENGKINIYIEIKKDLSWNIKSFWSDIKFNLKHAQDIKKVALVGDDENEELEEKLVELFKPFENAEIRWYGHSEQQEALEWVKI